MLLDSQYGCGGRLHSEILEPLPSRGSSATDAPRRSASTLVSSSPMVSSPHWISSHWWRSESYPHTSEAHAYRRGSASITRTSHLSYISIWWDIHVVETVSRLGHQSQAYLVPEVHILHNNTHLIWPYRTLVGKTSPISLYCSHMLQHSNGHFLYININNKTIYPCN